MRLIHGDAADMREIEDGSVHCIVTSPPYWGLRVYDGCPATVWKRVPECLSSEVPECEHEWEEAGTPEKNNRNGLSGGLDGEGRRPNNPEIKAASAFCRRCGAWRGCLGMEPSVELFIEHLMAVMAECWRVLRADGVCWVNLGDSYSGGGRKDFGPATNRGVGEAGHNAVKATPRQNDPGLKPKDLCLVPFRFALAAQAAGWWVRSDIIWAKPNPMPESVTDRPARSHEYVFLLAKRARYFYDAEAVREAHQEPWRSGKAENRRMAKGGDGLSFQGWDYDQRLYNPSGRNCRSVWNIATQSYPGAHFATFPETLVERCVLAGTSARGVCEHCGAPWRRVVEKEVDNSRYPNGPGGQNRYEQGVDALSTLKTVARYFTTTTGWEPACACEGNTGSARAVVLDPFCGSGTTVAVAERLGREGWGVEISRAYLDEQARKRVAPAAAQRSMFGAGL